MVDYGMVRKGTFLYDSLLHVPVLWWAPGQIASGTKSGRPHAVRRPLPDACGTNRRQEARTGPGVSLAGALLREEPRGSGSSRRRLTATWLPTSSRPTSPGRRGCDSAAHSRVETEDAGNAPNQDAAHRKRKFNLNETEARKLYRIADSPPKEYRDLAGTAEHASTRRDLKKRLAGWWDW